MLTPKTCFWCDKWRAKPYRNIGICSITQRPMPGPNECKIGEWEVKR